MMVGYFKGKWFSSFSSLSLYRRVSVSLRLNSQGRTKKEGQVDYFYLLNDSLQPKILSFDYFFSHNSSSDWILGKKLLFFCFIKSHWPEISRIWQQNRNFVFQFFFPKMSMWWNIIKNHIYKLHRFPKNCKSWKVGKKLSCDPRETWRNYASSANSYVTMETISFCKLSHIEIILLDTFTYKYL